MQDFHEKLNVLVGGFAEEAVVEVGNVPMPASGFHSVARGTLDFLEGAVAQQAVAEVALNHARLADDRAGLGDGHGAIDA